MEVLQILKFRYRQDLLNFADDWVATEAELEGGGDDEISFDELRQLARTGQTSALEHLLDF